MEQLEPKISVYYTSNATVVTLADEKLLEDDDINALEASLMPLLEGAVNLIIDFSSVVFLSSSVLGLLIRISKKINENKGTLKLCCINPKIYEIFKITRLDEIFDIYDDAKKALQSI